MECSASYASDGSRIIMLEEGWSELLVCGIQKLHNFLDNNCTHSISSSSNSNSNSGNDSSSNGSGSSSNSSGSSSSNSSNNNCNSSGSKICPRKNALFTKAEYTHMYTTVYTMCTQRAPYNWSHELYDRYGECIAHYVNNTVIPALRSVEGMDLLVELNKRWLNHRLYVRWMEKFFTYLDRYHIKLYAEINLSNKGITIFRRNVFREVASNVREAVLKAVEDDREGIKVDEGILRATVEMYQDLSYDNIDIYETELEDMVLPATRDYYGSLSEKWLREKNLCEYLLATEIALMKERSRVERYLRSGSAPKIETMVTNSLLGRPIDKLLDKGNAVIDLLVNEKHEDLHRLYNLFDLVPNGLQPIMEAFKRHIINQGEAILEKKIILNNCNNTGPRSENDPTFIQDVLALHDKYKRIVAECFGQSPGLQKAIKEGFEKIVNPEKARLNFSNLLSIYCDKLLRKSPLGVSLNIGSDNNDESRKTGEDVIEGVLCKVVELFDYIEDKDVFGDHYRVALARRLLHETSTSEDLEKSMISKLRLKCGNQFTSHLDGMLQDMVKASTLQRDFTNFLSLPSSTHPNYTNKQILGNIDFNAQILTTGHWPPYTPYDVKLPEEMTKCRDMFEAYYHSQDMHKHRKLTWMHILGNAVVSGHFQKKHDLICNTYQTCLLLLFNSPEANLYDPSDPKVGGLAFSDIVDALGLEESFVKKLIASFLLTKFRILMKVKIIDSENDDSNTTLTASTNWNDYKFRVDRCFTCPTRKIKIPTPVQEEQHNKERIEEDRSVTIEAAIVRLMKARKTMSHQNLINCIISQLSTFKPSPKTIKSCLDKMIEREFLERDATAPDQYKYMA